MMFLFRSAFWLVLLILLIPTDGEQQQKIYGMAQTAVADIGSFCERNPDTCVSGQYAIDVLVQKAQYGAHMIQALVTEHSGAGTPGQAPTQVPGQVPTQVPSPMPSAALQADAAHSATATQPAPAGRAAPSAMMPMPSAVPIEPTPWVEHDPQNTLTPEDFQAEWNGPNV